MRNYFRQPKRSHLLPLLGGMLWAAGSVSLFVATSAATAAPGVGAEPVPLLGPATVYVVGLGAAVLSALWGLLVWKEFRGATDRARVLVALMVVLLVAGLAMLVFAPPFGA
jgi:glucose uptake protein